MTMTTDMLETATVLPEDVTTITEADLAWWTDKLATLDWEYAVTYADGAPHEYITEKTAGVVHEDLVRAARVLHTFGEPQKFYKWTRIYLAHDGWKYWTMDGDHRLVNLVNRGRAHHIYGVQNAPRTISATPTAYGRIATYWDAEYAATDEERAGFVAHVNEVTCGYRKCRTLDLGAGTGLALDLELTEAFRLTAVDPSQPMLNDLVRKHPLVARVEPMSFTKARALRVLAGTKFDLVLALGGSGSYLTPDDWAALPDHATGRFVLSVYAAGEAPLTGDLSDAELATARDRARAFAENHGGRVERVGRFDVAVVAR
jgi:hypothetical protein